MWESVAQVRRLSSVVAGLADETRDERARVGAVTDVVWESVAADRWRLALEAVAERLSRTVGELDAASQSLAAHAAAAETTLQAIAAAEAFVQGVIDSAVSVSGDAVDAAASAAGQALPDLIPGSLGWLAEARVLGWRG